MRNFMMAIILGEFVVWILNVFWCFYILEIVPQTGDVSLYTSEKNGEIATIPLSIFFFLTNFSIFFLRIF